MRSKAEIINEINECKWFDVEFFNGKNKHGTPLYSINEQ
jgi:hypothetical protein